MMSDQKERGATAVAELISILDRTLLKIENLKADINKLYAEHRAGLDEMKRLRAVLELEARKNPGE